MDFEQNHDGDKSGRTIYEDESKKTYPDVPNISKGKRKMVGKNVWFVNLTTT